MKTNKIIKEIPEVEKWQVRILSEEEIFGGLSDEDGNEPCYEVEQEKKDKRPSRRIDALVVSKGVALSVYLTSAIPFAVALSFVLLKSFIEKNG